jgi:hypothetical protein
MNSSFVLGNGTSRAGLNLTALQHHGKIYGCNALYRDFEPDYLIAVDPKMIFEIQSNGFQRSHSVWTNQSASHYYDDGFNYFTPKLPWSSGPCALHLATTHNPTEIYIIGFDFTGVDNKFNNIYADTFNYKSSSEIPTYWGNWEKQTEFVIKSNPSIKFYRVVNDESYIPSWNPTNLENLNFVCLSRKFSDLVDK